MADETKEQRPIPLRQKTSYLEAKQTSSLIADSTHQPPKADGLNIWQTVFVLAGFLSSFGLLSLHAILINTGLLGVLVATVTISLLIYTTVLLGRCWNMVRSKWQCERYPVGAISYEAYGARARDASNVIVAINCFVTNLGMIIMSSELVYIVGGPALYGTFCYYPVLFGMIVCPFMWFGTPKDAWQLGAFSIVTGELTFLLLFIAVVVEDTSPPDAANPDYNVTTTDESIIDADSTMLIRLAQLVGIAIFVNSGHYAYTTVQQDMQHPEMFSRAVALAYTHSIGFQLLPIFVATLIFHTDMLASITSDTTVFTILPRSSLVTVPLFLLLLHNTFVCATVNNPLNQYLESVLDVPKDFTWKRVALRTSVVVVQVFIVETIPRFGILLTLIGGCCNPVTAFVIPSACYLRLRKIHTPEKYKESRLVWLLETVVCYLSLALTPVIMVTILYVTLTSIFSGKTVFTVPCYVNPMLAHE